MCLILFSLSQHPVYKLILVANRDEFYDRPTQKAHFWKDEGFSDVLAGKDERGGGTWMGITKTGRFAALTNYRDLNIKPNAPTRGHLVSDFLKTNIDAKTYLKTLKHTASNYNGFNLLVGTTDELYWFSNQGSQIIETIPKGHHGLCNALLNTPWHKVEQGKALLEYELMNKSSEVLFESFEKLLQTKTLAPDSQLPQTGLSYYKEKAFSSIFIDTLTYGTRSSTILLVDYDNKAVYHEITYRQGLIQTEKQTFELHLEI